MGRVLIGCETPGIVRRAFVDMGHDAWSVDLLPSSTGAINTSLATCEITSASGWDLLTIVHSCTRLCNSGVRWLREPPPGRALEEIWQELEDGAKLFSDRRNAPGARALLARIFGAEWEGMFAAVVAADDVARKKPAPDAYLEVLSQLELPAASCLAFEDAGNGLRAAVRAGIPCIVTRSIYFSDDDFTGALAVIDDLTALDI